MEVTQKQSPLMDLSVAISPWTHITQIRLVRSSIESKHGDAPPIQLQNRFDATTTLDREAQGLSVHTFLEVVAGDVLQISAEFILDYSISKSPIGITNEAANAFGKINGIHNVWPYWREYVQSVSVRAGFPPLVLPLVTGSSLVAYYSAKDAGASTNKNAEA